MIPSPRIPSLTKDKASTSTRRNVKDELVSMTGDDGLARKSLVADLYSLESVARRKPPECSNVRPLSAESLVLSSPVRPSAISAAENVPTVRYFSVVMVPGLVAIDCRPYELEAIDHRHALR